MGEGPHTDRHQIASANHDEQATLENQNRGVLPSDSEHFLSADDRAFVPASAGNDREIQSGLVPDALYRSAALARIDGIGFNVLSHCAKGALSGLASAAEVLAVSDVCRNRSFREQLQSRNGGSAWD